MEKKLPKLIRWLSSIRVAIGLLIGIALLCALATLIPQGLKDAEYIALYGRPVAGIVGLLGLDHALSSLWFYGLALLFSVNLVSCTALRLIWAMKFSRARGGMAAWGSPVLHLGLCVLLLGVAVSLLAAESLYYEIPVGESALIDVGRSPFRLQVERFAVEYYDDGMTPKQYRSAVMVLDEGGEALPVEIEVNDPLKRQGVSVIQQSYGWNYTVTISTDQVSQTMDLYKEHWVTLGGSGAEQINLGLCFYPDYEEIEGVPSTASDRDQQPRMVWLLLQGDTVVSKGVLSPGEKSTIQEPLAVSFDSYRYYTGLQAQYDPGISIIFCGFALVCLGLLTRYLLPMETRGRKEKTDAGINAQP